MQMLEPLVSIIIPTFNRGELIKKTLISIKNQSYLNWECIIIDDDSTDDTESVVKRFSDEDLRFIFFRRPRNLPKGPNSCRKYGFEKSKGKYTQWFDSDDLMEEHKLKHSVKLISEHKVGCVIHNFVYFRENSYDNLIFNKFSNEEALKVDFFSGDIVLNFQSILWDRSQLDLTFLKDNIEYAEDAYFIGNHILRGNFDFEIIDKVLVKIRKHEVSLTSSFSKRSLKHIIDEVYVREYFWKKVSGYLVQPCLKMYLKSLKYLLYVNKYKHFFTKLLKVLKSVNFRLKPMVFQLGLYGVIYFLSRKGLTSYQSCINKL